MKWDAGTRKQAGGQEETCPAFCIPRDSFSFRFLTPRVSLKLQRGSRRDDWVELLSQILLTPFLQDLFWRDAPHTPGGPGAEGERRRLVKFLKVKPSPRSPVSAPGLQLHAGSCGCSGKGAAAALRAASPSPPLTMVWTELCFPKQNL